MPSALICAKELTPSGCFLHLSTDTGLVKVEVPLDVAQRARLSVQVEVPEGDLTDPQVAAGWEWRW